MYKNSKIKKMSQIVCVLFVGGWYGNDVSVNNIFLISKWELSFFVVI